MGVLILNLILKSPLFQIRGNLILVYVLQKQAVHKVIQLQSTDLQVCTFDLEAEYRNRIQISTIKLFKKCKKYIF